MRWLCKCSIKEKSGKDFVITRLKIGTFLFIFAGYEAFSHFHYIDICFIGR